MPGVRGAARRPAARVLTLGLLALTLLLLFAAWTYQRALYGRVRAHEREELGAIARLKAELLQQWLAERRDDAQASASALVAHGVGRLVEQNGDSDTIDRQLHLLKESRHLVSVGVLAPDGRVVNAVPPLAAVISPPSTPEPTMIFEPALGPTRRGGEWIRLTVPVRDEPSAALLGWLTMEIDPGRVLGPMLEEWPTPSRSAETLLVRRDGERISFLTPLRRRPGMVLPFRTDAAETGLGAMLASGGLVIATDYAGARVFAYGVPVAGSPWMLVAKEDVAESLDPVRRAEWGIAIALAALLLAAGLLVKSGNARAQRRLESRVEDAERQFRVIFDRADDALIFGDSDGRILAANARARALLGLREDDLPGLEVADLVPPEERAMIRAEWSALDERGRFRRRLRMLGGGGETFAGELTVVRTPFGRYLGTLDDVREAVAAELRQKQSRRMARLGTWEWELHSGAVHWDEEVFNLLGYDSTADSASVEALLEQVHPHDRERLRGALDRMAAGEAVLDVEVRLRPSAGRDRTLHLVGELLRDASGSAARVVGAMQDLTERRAAELELAGARAQLAEAQKLEAIGRLAAGVSHDINNIAGVILGNAELAELALEPGHPAREALTEIRQASLRAGNLTRQLQGFSRRQAPRRQVVELSQAIDEARRLIETVLGSRVRLEIELGHELDRVRLDPTQLAQVLINLAANARDAMPRGGTFAIRASQHQVSAEEARRLPPLVPGSAVRIDVEDDGGGMDPGTLAHCFEPFFTTKGPGLGTGLGLSTARAILDASGGAIDAASELGVGTRFSIFLPSAAATAAPACEETATVAGQTRGDGEVVLVVDDVEAMREVVSNMLAGLGYRALSVGSAAAAIEILGRPEPRIRLLLTDVVMPDGDGRELARRAAEVDAALPILFMTGYADSPPSGKPLDIPAERLLEKPFTTGELGRRVRRALAGG